MDMKYFLNLFDLLSLGSKIISILLNFTGVLHLLPQRTLTNREESLNGWETWLTLRTRCGFYYCLFACGVPLLLFQYICFSMRVISLNWAWWLLTGSLCTCIYLLHFLISFGNTLFSHLINVKTKKEGDFIAKGSRIVNFLVEHCVFPCEWKLN